MIIIALILSVASVAWAQKTSAFIDVESNLMDTKDNSYSDAGISHQFTDKLGAYAFFLVMGNWTEAYFGPSWSPDKTMNMGVYVGADQGPNGLRPRYAASFWTCEGNLSFSAALEVNNDTFRGDDSGLWYQLDFRYALNGKLAIGIKDRRPMGVGPALDFRQSDILTFYTAWLPLASEEADWHPKMLIFGVHASL